MKGIVPLSVILSFCIGLANSEAGSKDEQPKHVYHTANSIGSTSKPDLLSYQQITQHYGNKFQPQHVGYQQQYQPRTQHLQQSVPYNHQPEPIKKPYMIPQHQPTPIAMVIIAQPAYIPASMLQHGNVAQQLLQYFQGVNSQFRYQYIPANHHPVHRQQYPVPVQTQQVSQYLQYQPQQETTQYQPTVPSAPTAQAQTSQSQFSSSAMTDQAQTSQSQFFAHEALPTPQALISQQHRFVPNHLNQPKIPEGRSIQHQTSQQQIEVQPQELQEVDQQTEVQSPDISRLAQQAAQHFLVNGGLNGGSRTAPAIITGLELFPPEQQEKIKAQLSTHFGSPLKPLNLESSQNARAQEHTSPSRKYYHDNRQRMKSDKFVPSIQVKDGEITQSSPGGGDKL